MQCAERRQRDLRCTDLKTGAVDRVELPRRQNRHRARCQFHVHQLTRRAPLALNTTHPLSVQWMPAILDHHIPPDMGRMTARLPSAARTGPSRPACRRHLYVDRHRQAQRHRSPSLARRRACPITRPGASTIYCLGIGACTRRSRSCLSKLVRWSQLPQPVAFTGCVPLLYSALCFRVAA